MYDFDSLEETHFSWYLQQLQDNGIIIKWTYHPPPFLLSERTVHVYEKMLKTKTVVKDSVILNDHKYTADFLIHWNPQWKGKFFINLHENKCWKDAYFIAQGERNFTVVDVKGSFMGPRNNSAVTFPLDQKWVYQRYKIYIQKIIPVNLFQETFVPFRYKTTDVSGKSRKINFKERSLLEYMVLINK